MFSFGITVHAYAKYFDGPWKNEAFPWIALILKVAFDGYAGFGMMKRCMLQLKYSSTRPWVEEF